MSRYAVCLIGLLLALVTVLVRAVTEGAGAPWWQLAAWTLFGGALWLVRRTPARNLTVLAVAGGIAVIATGLAAPPSTSTDSYRYAWDGRVQTAGISPYDHAPADPALTPLRDEWLFPESCWAPYRVPLPDGGCTRINRPTVHTIYPPLAQIYFLGVDLLSPEGIRHKGLQVGGVAMAMITLLALWRGWGARAAACWGWCPAVPVEAVNNAHVDMLGVLLVVFAFGTARGRGALLGAAIAAKLTPITVLPGALSWVRSKATDWGRVLRIVVPAGLVVVLAYLPYVLASGGSVVGYLVGYFQEEGYESPAARERYALLRLVMPDSWAPFVALALLAAIALYILRRGDPERPWSGALIVSGALLLLLTPSYSWYALLVVALAAMDGRWEWLGVAVAGAVAYLFVYTYGPATFAYALAALGVGLGWAVRRANDVRTAVQAGTR